MDKQIEGVNKNFFEKIRMLSEILKSLKDKNLEFDELFKKTDTIMRLLTTNVKKNDESVKDLKEISSTIPNLRNEIRCLIKNFESIQKVINDKEIENVNKYKNVYERNNQLAEENKNLASKLKDILLLIKNVDQKFEEKVSKLIHRKPDEKSLDDEFKQEVCNRLIVDEKKFIEINDNMLILDKNINIISKKLDLIESSLNINNLQPMESNQALCVAYNGCEVHSFRSNFILKGKENLKMIFEANKEIKYKFSEKENLTNFNFISQTNDINLNINNTYERTSKKYNLNNLYLKCDPVNFINYSKNKLKNYLPKFYFSGKKSFVNIVEAYFEINQEDFKFGPNVRSTFKQSKHYTNELFVLGENDSIVMQEEEIKSKDSELEDILMEEGKFLLI